MKTNTIYTDDCLEGMPKRLPDGCIDLMPTDPPYAISFMGKKWDTFHRMEDFFIPRWRECLRVLKAGGFAFVMCSPRADVMATQILCLQEAGFMVGFTPIFWAYASGFPKAQNIGKAVDKKLGKRGDESVGFSRAGDYGGRNLVDKPIPFKDYQKPNCISPQARALDGSYAGMQLKPAVEVILVAMKPLSEKTYVDQALRNRKGIAWLDEGRIPYKTQEDIDESSGKNRHADFDSGPRDNKVYGADKRSRAEQGNYDASKGRFPANLLVSDDALNDGRSGHSTGHYSYQLKKSPYDGGWKSLEDKGYLKESNNSFSRYFSLDSWFDKKLKELPKGVQKTFPFLIVPKASKAEKNRGCEELYWEKDNSSFGYHQVDRQRWEWLGKKEDRIYKETGKRVSLRARGNVHPTVKPIKLMSYLIALGSREGDVILDPYIGTGRTAIAATMMRRRYIGFDSSPESVKIAKASLSEVQLRLI